MIKPTPWIERKFDFNFPVTHFPVVIERLRGTLDRLEAVIKDLPPDKQVSKPDGKWSVKEVVGHLYDIEELWQKRIDDFLAKKDTLQAADMTNAKTQAADHNRYPIKDLFEQFKKARIALIERVQDFDEDQAGLTSLHPRLQKPMRLVDSLFFVAEHDDHELTRIRNLIKS